MSYKRRYMARTTFVFKSFDVVLIRVDLNGEYTCEFLMACKILWIEGESLTFWISKLFMVKLIFRNFAMILLF